MDPIRIDARAHRAWKGATELRLAPLPFGIRRVLAERAGTMVNRDELARLVWGYDAGKTLDMHVRGLRQALGDDAANPRYITTVRGIGFRFDGHVEGTPPAAVLLDLMRQLDASLGSDCPLLSELAPLARRIANRLTALEQFHAGSRDG
ncbi:hypothetical protein C1I98_11165 [Spongiactinospora gelatinilytica]|uniref:OmpR/PhoB-type domain-containing protein n=1 Tax=Spongiactinospora gelatinilytica TaxID=2666298 RepID=A0A2W2HV92_9ACTN|nr:winged helix-turn-helix domain-containing protein [Spongiactinospora gelatinilytica]PZG49867.1 hypothetical protein C1I98_11165 [Spongiactinospora gelatinilytica]